MPAPIVKMISVSNVFSRLMCFVNKGDVEIGHCHNYDHATLISTGAVRYEILDGPNGNTVASKDVFAPNFVYVEKNKFHRLIALEPNTVCACIHALRTIDEDIVDPDYFIDTIEADPNTILDIMYEKSGDKMKYFCDVKQLDELWSEKKF